jgi:3-oxoacyl-[acyl-carrier protein] reductase
MEMGLSGRLALVTGGSKGIGFGIALALAGEGCDVCLVARNEGPLHAAAETIRAKTGKAISTIAGDVADATFIDRIVNEVAGIDILVSNAAGPPPGSFLAHDDAAWLAAIDQNFLSTVRLVRALAPGMKERGWGRVVSITSTLAKEPTPLMVLSASTRAAVSAFTKAISIELAPFGVTANVVAPGGVQTERLESLMQQTAEREGKTIDEIRARSAASIPMQRFASPDELADLVVFLASERGRYLTGMSLMADGGLTKGVF